MTNHRVAIPSVSPMSLPQVPSKPFSEAFIDGSADLILYRLLDNVYSDGIIGVRMREMMMGEGSVFVRNVCKVASAVAGDMSEGPPSVSCSFVTCKRGL